MSLLYLIIPNTILHSIQYAEINDGSLIRNSQELTCLLKKYIMYVGGHQLSEKKLFLILNIKLNYVVVCLFKKY